MIKSPDAFRTISEVSEWLDRPTHVLRFWESKFPQIKPVKRAGGRRYYRPQDMLLLGGIKRLLHDDGMTIKGVQKMLREQGIAQVAALSQPLEDADLVAALGQADPDDAALAPEARMASLTPEARMASLTPEAPMTLMAEDSPATDNGAQVLPFRDPSRPIADAPPRAPSDQTAAELAATMPMDDSADDTDIPADAVPDDSAASLAAPVTDDDQPSLPFDAPPLPRAPQLRAPAPRGAALRPTSQPTLPALAPAAVADPDSPPAPAKTAAIQLAPDVLARLAALTLAGRDPGQPALTAATRSALLPLTRRLVAVAERMRAAPPQDRA